MANGTNPTVDEAKKIINAFVKSEITRTGKAEHELAVGQKIDLALLIRFMDEIHKINGDFEASKNTDHIDAVRVYFGKSTRKGTLAEEEYDLIMVPVLSTTKTGRVSDLDYHKVYVPAEKLIGPATIIGNTLPCPNVCPNGINLDCQ